MGVCSSRAFLIHKWVEISRFFQIAEPGRRDAAGVCALKPHVNMEINERMSKRFLWLLGVVVLVSIGFLVACGSNYNQSSDGLVLVGSQGSGLIETFSFNPFNGHVSAIANTPTDTSNKACVLNGVPTSMVIDPAGHSPTRSSPPTSSMSKGSTRDSGVQDQFRRDDDRSREPGGFP